MKERLQINLTYWGGPDVVTKVLTREQKRQKQRSDDRRGSQICYLAGFEDEGAVSQKWGST